MGRFSSKGVIVAIVIALSHWKALHGSVTLPTPHLSVHRVLSKECQKLETLNVELDPMLVVKYLMVLHSSFSVPFAVG